MLKGAEIVLRCMRAEGVDLVFGYPGGAIMPLYDALDGSGSAARSHAARAGRGVCSRRLRAGHGKSWRGHGHQRAGRDQPGDRHRRRQNGFGSSGLHHRTGADAR